MKSISISGIWCLFNCSQWMVFGSIVDDLKKIMDDDFLMEEENTDIVDIDQDHLRHTPECGDMYSRKNKPSAKSRITNAAESDRHYPWVVEIQRNNPHFNSIHKIPPNTGSCAGSIITKTSAITNAHCICGTSKIDNAHPDFKYVECQGGETTDLRQPINEIRPIVDKDGVRNGNEMRAGIGNKDKTEKVEISIMSNRIFELLML